MKLVNGTQTAVLFGATGLVGGHLLDRLLEEAGYARVVAVTRRELDRRHPKLTNPVFPLAELDRHAACLAGVDDVFIALGTTRKRAGSAAAFRQVDLHYVLAAARVARAQGANQCLLVSSAGADADSRLLYPRTKGEAEDALADLGFWALRIFRPGILLGNRDEFRPGERLGAAVTTLLRSLSPRILGDYNPVEADRLAQRMVEAARDTTGGLITYGARAIIH